MYLLGRILLSIFDHVNTSVVDAFSQLAVCTVIHDLLHGMGESKPYLFQFVELKKTLEAVNLDKIFFFTLYRPENKFINKKEPPKKPLGSI